MSKVLSVISLIWKYANLSVSTSKALQIVKEIDDNNDDKITVLELMRKIISNIVK